MELIRGCNLGITESELRRVLEHRYDEFMKWMNGQTMAICDDHGAVVYPRDLQQWVSGKPIED